MKLVLAEKPSVAMSLSKVIGANQRGDGYMEGNGYFVSWCVGHLVELSQPEAYDEKYAKWRYDDLPILPEHWQYQVSASTKKQFGILKKLMQRKDVESLICATDAGREGELIFRLVYHQCGCKKPVERLWISSMEDSAIREGFQKLRPGTEYDALYEAALCRERADWIVGINATRLFSCLYGQTLNVGRVMTPTLAMVVMRDAAIRAFKPEPFYSAELKFRDFQAGGERMKAKADAEKLVAECCQAGSAIITKVEQKEKSENPPFNLDFSETRETLAAMPSRFWAGIPNVPKKKKESMSIYTCFLQHVLNSMKPNGKAAIVLPTGFLTAKSSVEGKLLKHIVNERLVYGVISMPSNVFANTGTNVSVVFFDNSKSSDKVILIDASKLGEEYQEGNNKKVRLTPDEIDMIVDTFLNKKTVEDFSVAVSYEDIEAKKCSLAAGQYFDVKIEYVELTQEEFENKMSELTSNLQSYFDEGNALQKEIMEQLKKVKYE